MIDTIFRTRKPFQSEKLAHLLETVQIDLVIIANTCSWGWAPRAGRSSHEESWARACTSPPPSRTPPPAPPPRAPQSPDVNTVTATIKMIIITIATHFPNLVLHMLPLHVVHTILHLGAPPIEHLIISVKNDKHMIFFLISVSVLSWCCHLLCGRLEETLS